MTMFKKAYWKSWILGVWSGRLDFGILDSWALGLWTTGPLDSKRLDAWTLDSWTRDNDNDQLFLWYSLPTRGV